MLGSLTTLEEKILAKEPERGFILYVSRKHQAMLSRLRLLQILLGKVLLSFRQEFPRSISHGTLLPTQT